MTSRPGRMILAMLAGGAAVVCMSSSIVAAVLVGLTVGIVVWDLLSEPAPVPQDASQVSSEPTPKRLTVDLRRRR